LNHATVQRILVGVKVGLPVHEELAMIRTAAALFSAAFLLATTALAQTPAQNAQDQSYATGRTVTVAPDGQRTTTIVMVPITTCPVSMQAKQGGLTQMIKTGKKPPEPQQYDPMPEPSQRIHLILAGFGKDKRVTLATVMALGLSPRSRLQNTGISASTDMRRSLGVKFTPDADGTVSGDIVLQGFTSVTSLQLGFIQYSDGSTWQPKSGNACIVKPDPLMLIAGW
jgi:hypothetical protein